MICVCGWEFLDLRKQYWGFGVWSIFLLNWNLFEEFEESLRFGTMAVPWSMTLYVARMIWMALGGWVVSCLNVADEIAGSLRTGGFEPLHVD
ncbi:hypothetical protein Sango_0847500 [Sesamum angolense]|uniref:Uncharacterized protein n=1 Tax=Sesamum angolense TaxID=2727404 RepID=A0AAE1X4W5_9LAMI|nr:hypothetical protein Sango_0847500 [Sesamum angolense]